ncbi:hypothetical protein PNEG_02116 [Pneumocystis murina B123]|uniref:SUZ domain-containing protein n=1 Tax=Pneumocystis murina (strain B123) TaxID=1069680 RepID=M7PGE8_PNEMU|nr:hypothetical protein PNEG_02116 [Pneumocystis murina B123]EMR09529.1 hypothetical protein PNEG_02116 [Pneumocystis murina B123]
MNDQKYQEKVPDLWDEWENENRIVGFPNDKADLSCNKKTTHEDNVRLWKEANQQVPDVEILNSPRTVYKPSLKILRRSVDHLYNSSASTVLPQKPISTESEQGQREKEQRYREARQKIFGVSSTKKDLYIPVRSPIGPLLGEGFVKEKDQI